MLEDPFLLPSLAAELAVMLLISSHFREEFSVLPPLDEFRRKFLKGIVRSPSRGSLPPLGSLAPLPPVKRFSPREEPKS